MTIDNYVVQPNMYYNRKKKRYEPIFKQEKTDMDETSKIKCLIGDPDCPTNDNSMVSYCVMQCYEKGKRRS